MEIFNKEDFDQIREYAGKAYDAKQPVLQTFKNQIEKLKFFVQYLDDNLMIDLEINRTEKINKQAGRGAKHNNFADYLLVGFCPRRFNVGKTLFIKAALHNLSGNTSFVIELDVDFASRKNAASEEMTKMVRDLQPKHRIELPLSEISDFTWGDLFMKTKQNLNNLIDDYMLVYETFNESDLEHFGIIANMGWNSHGWKDFPTEKDLEASKSFGYVNKNNEMHESFNFGQDTLPKEPDGTYIGYTPSFNVKVKYKDSIRVVFLSSTNLTRERVIVGCYAFPKIESFNREAQHKYFEKYKDGNIRSKVSDIVYFENYIDADSPGFLPDGKNLSKQRYNYLEKTNIERIFNAAIEANNNNTKLRDVMNRVLDNKREQDMFKSPNIILYGPPGTGKTYNTIELAYEIINGHKSETHKEAQDFFKQERGNRIEFITFHQNYAYEDFVQGLKPDYNSSQLRFSKVDGIFKNICTNAIFEYLVSAKRSIPAKVSPDFNTIFSLFVDWLKSEGLENVQIKTTEGNPIIIKDIANDKYIHASHGESDVKHTVSAKRLEILFNKFQNIDQIKSISKDITETIGGCNTSMYWAIFNEFLNFKNRNIDDIEQVEQALESEVLDIEEKKQRINNFGLVKISKFIEENNPEVPFYVLIIDEINRANISRVFGELITLIEKDKRLGQAHELIVNLPGGDEFAIPPNLCIIGTMNTADKSIALVDIALRRRFEFRKYYPDYNINNIHFKEKLKSLNKKIRELKGADFQIGHSYFMGDNFDLKYTMNNKAIPLLYEYFMNDTDSVKDVLKAGGFQYEDENTTDSGLIEFVDQSSETKEKVLEKTEESESES